MVNQAEIKRFWDEGAILVRDLIPAHEILDFRKQIENSIPAWKEQNVFESTATGGRLKTDLLSNSLLRKLLLDPRIIALAHSLLGAEPVYFGDSTFVYGPTSRGWHRDNRTSDRNVFTGQDWQGNYPLIRFGIYLQDHEKHSGGLGVRLRSHLPSKKNPFINKRILPRSLRNYFAGRTGKATNMASKPGDLVIWTLRTTHSADAIRLRVLPKIRLSPGIENYVPSWARLPHDGTRMACFITFAAASDHLNRYLDYLQTRDYMIDIWSNSSWDEECLILAKESNLNVIRTKADCS